MQAGQTKPGLSKVYAAAGLPQFTLPDRLPAGERCILTNQQLAHFVQELYQPPSMSERATTPVKKEQAIKPTGRPKGRRS